MARKKRKIVLMHKRAPGDIVTMTALVRDLVLAHGDSIEVGVKTTAMDLWRHNPYITDLGTYRRNDVEYIDAQYGRGIRDQNYRPIHFLAYWHEDFQRQTGITVPLTLPYPDLHLSTEEKTVPLVEGRYWVTLSGGKSDYPIKVWHAAKLQEVVHALGDMGLGVVQIGSNDNGHWHPALQGDNVIDYRGKSNLRDMMRLIYHAEGVICGITCAMHMAAALQKPCVVIGGGREAWWWEAYVRENKGLAPVQHLLKVPHRYLHTIGLLDCCKHHGCWRNKVVAISKDTSLCYHPVMHPEQPVPLCMDMIKPSHVIEAIMKYYEDLSLPPITPATTAIPCTPETTALPCTPETTALPCTPETTALPCTPETTALPCTLETVTNPDPVTQKPALRSLPILRLFDDPVPPPTSCTMPPTTVRAESVVVPGPVNKCGQPQNSHRVKASVPVKVPPGMTPAEFLKKAQFRVNNNAKPEGRGELAERPMATHPGALSPDVTATDAAIDHPDVGGKFTICILFYGGDEYFDLHRRCLTSIIGTVPRNRMDLRVGSNALNQKSLNMLDGYVQQGVITKHYRHVNNDLKYPVMREMFFDPALPITTKWVLWFDDDSIADRTPAWLNLLAQQIIQFHRRDNAHMFGAPFVSTAQAGQRSWIESRPWFKQRPWRTHKGVPSPNGNKILFVTGGFWAITHEAIVRADIPDVDIGHNGGDIIIGEQLYQAGYGMKAWNAMKQFVNTSSVPRRGVTLPAPGKPGHTPRLLSEP